MTGPRFRFTSETGPLKEVLLCRPDHYHWIPTNAVAEHTLAAGVAFDAEKARAQYGQLEAALAEAGVVRHYLPPEPHLPYQVYTRDSSQITPWGPIVTALEKPQRRGEYATVLKFYQDEQTPIWRYATDGTMEGGDIHFIRPGLAVIGYSGVRTNAAGAEQFRSWLEEEGWEVLLYPFDAHFLHLDLLFCMAAPGLAVACEEVLDEGFLDWMRARQIRWVPVSYKNAMRLGCNLLALGHDRVISPKHNVEMNAALKAEGLEVLEPELDLFTQGGGGAHCMTMPLLREDD